MNKQDTLVKVDNTLYQHGANSDRVYLMQLDKAHYDTIIEELEEVATSNGYTKIVAKIPQLIENKFASCGYVKEAYIPKYYKGEDDCIFMCKYYEDNRKIAKNADLLKNVIKSAKSKDTQNGVMDTVIARELNTEDANEMALLYKKVFASYPFPIHDPEYIKATMKDNVNYFGIFDNNNLIALSSSELNSVNKNAEMTDFAVLPEYRGKNLSLHLLNLMERELKKSGYIALYTIARAVSYGMNSTFAKAGYHYCGTLINNTNISGGIESMNVWCKSIN